MSTIPQLTSTHVWLSRHRENVARAIAQLQGKLDLLDELISECHDSITVSPHTLDSQPVIITGPPKRPPGRPRLPVSRKLYEHSPGHTRNKPPPQHNPYDMAPEDMVATRTSIPLTVRHDLAFTALEAAGSRGLTAEQLAINTGMKRGTASSLLSSLKAHGFATHKIPLYFVVGPNNAKPTDFNSQMSTANDPSTVNPTVNPTVNSEAEAHTHG